MLKKLPVDVRLLIVKKALKSENKSQICKQYQISRTLLYRWIKTYESASKRSKRLSLSPKIRQGANHHKSLSSAIQRKIRNLALKNPQLSAQKIAKKTGVSAYGAWITLKRAGISSEVAREQYFARRGKSLIKEIPVNDKVTMLRRRESGEKVASICRDFQVSRTIYYRYARRFDEGEGRREALVSLRPRGEKHWRFIPGIREQILNIVVDYPVFSAHKIEVELTVKAGKKVFSDFGVYTYLKKMGLNTYQRRLAYAKSHAPITVPVPKVVREEKTPIGSIPSVSSLAPPGFLRGFFSSRPFIIFLSTFIPALFAYILISTLFNTQGLTSRIGMIFSFTSLIFGLFFFIYSLKYYLTIALVLSFSRKGEDQKKRGIGLQADLSNIHLERQPFVSVHIASFNEKRVINRLLTAATSLDYKNYEIIVADDSTDETRDLLATWSKHPRVKISHRDSREGFKGGALREALKITDPKAEFIMVFDADFIPYPDTITQFLKYFQSTCGTLDFQQEARSKKQESREKNHASYFPSASLRAGMLHDSNRIAAIQGYQWHVLNKSENWVTRGVRSEYSGSYVIERSGEEIYSGLKQISGSVYMIRRDVLESVGWGNSITEDFQLTLKLYEKGYKVVYTPYVQAPAEAVSTIKRLIRQRMRWAEGHSFNVKRMFKRLLFGKWEAAPIHPRGESNPHLGGGEISPQDGKIFIPSPLTLSEKLEFIYLTPYYLQAAFFIIGTISWFIAEVIFQVRLPFWTEVWGWSLILTNMLALPLMNMVGLFLEEAEEKDYMGLLSFIMLSYIVAPFQAYAAVKGFLAKEEGPWFRTPKTGRITDTFTPGRFYRFVWGVFGRGKPAVAEALAGKPAVAPALGMGWQGRALPAVGLTSNPVFAFATANNQFSSFKIKPRRLRWVGRSVVVVLLISAMFLNLVSFGQNDIFSIPGKKALKVSGKSNFQAGERPEFTLRIPQKAPETKTLSFFKRVLAPGIAEAAEPVVQASLFDSKGQEMKDAPLSVTGNKDDFKLALSPWENLAPGQYTLKVRANNPGETSYEATQDFTWGVLAINTNKSIYTPRETVKLGFGTLDNEGRTLCNSRLILKIKYQKSKIEDELSTENGRIKPSGECSQNSVTNLADYLAEFQVQGIGTYRLHLTARTDAGERSIDDKFEVRESVPFDIERTSYPTRIYPPAEYPVTIKVTANENFRGEVVESVPESFDIKVQSEKFKVKENTIFKEERQWQIAADVVATLFMDTPDATQQLLLSAGGFWSGSFGTAPVYDTAQKKSGLASWKSDSGASNNASLVYRVGVVPTGANLGARITAYFRLTNLPGSTATLFGVTTSANQYLVVRITSGGVLQLWGGGSQIGSNGSTINPGGVPAWYRLSLVYKLNASGQISDAKLFLDGVQDISVTGLTLTTGADFALGWVDTPGASKVLHFHHVYADDDTSLTDTGDIRVTAKLPNADSTRGFDTVIGGGTGDCADGSTEYGCVNDRPISESTGWRQTATADVTENFNIESASQGDVDISGNTLVARTAWVWAKKGSGPGACGTTADMWDNNSASAVELTASSALYTKITDSTTYPSNPAAGMNSCTTAQDTYFYETGVLIASLGDPVPEAALLLAPLSFFAPKIIKSIQKGTLVEDTLSLLRRIIGTVSKWLYGYMAIWLHGYMAKWLRRRRRRRGKKDG